MNAIDPQKIIRHHGWYSYGVFVYLYLLINFKMKKIISLSLVWLAWLIMMWCGSQKSAPADEVKPAVEAPSADTGSADFDTQSADDTASLASCLTEKWYKMYGTERCGHCKKQKETLGSDFDAIDYIDCDKESASCTTAGIQGYPTWVDWQGQAFPWGKTLEQLKSMSGC